jgi:hypothetical protein
MLCGISPPFGGLFPIQGHVIHVLRTRAPCAHSLYCYRELRTRLACVKHAASVRSEPGSNSRLKLVVLKIKIPARAGTRLQNELFKSLDSLKSPFLPKQKRVEPNGFWHILSSCQRAMTPCPAGSSIGEEIIQKTGERVKVEVGIGISSLWILWKLFDVNQKSESWPRKANSRRVSLYARW